MSLLAPLFALGIFAVGLPILFHLIQKKPKGQTEFSSLMFLSPSPPRLTRRSRLDNLLLLLLRALCILLLALAFARPFFRSMSMLGLTTPARRIVLLVDTSASMQRQDLWEQATAEIDEVLNDLQPTDQFALITFDRDPTTLVSFDDLTEAKGALRTATIRESLKDIRPTWYATNMGRAIVTAADILETAEETTEQTGVLPPQIILVSDMQSGSAMSELDSYEWPRGVQLDARTVNATKTSNASLSVLQLDDSATTANELRVRVRNSNEAATEQFRVGWADDSGTLIGREYDVHVPAGQSHVVRVALPAAGAKQLMLVGDDDSFDNSHYVATPEPQEFTLLFVGSEAAQDRASLHYYLSRISLDNLRRTVHVDVLNPTQTLEAVDRSQTPLVVVTQPLSAEIVSALQTYIEGGGRVLVSIDSSSDLAPMSQTIERLLDIDDVLLEEAEVDDYVMLGMIDFQHPLFQTFADPRFNDFTKVRFWKHRRLSSSHEEPWQMLARFDDESPALIEKRRGDGYVWVLTAGWQPDESQLALSTKFVPLIAGMFDRWSGETTLLENYTVGDDVELPSSKKQVIVQRPNDTQEVLPVGTSTFDNGDVPGLYAYLDGQDVRPFAINLDADESRTSPFDEDELGKRGVVIGEAETMTEIEDHQRQKRDTELEASQKIWQWLIVAVLGLLFVETWVGGWLSRRRPAPTRE